MSERACTCTSCLLSKHPRIVLSSPLGVNPKVRADRVEDMGDDGFGELGWSAGLCLQ